MTPTRKKMMDDLELAGYVADTKRRYLKTIQRLAEFHNQSPDKLEQDDIRQWVKQLTSGKLSPQRLGQHFAALKFLYRRTLGQPEAVSFLCTPKAPKHLPIVLSPQEVARVLVTITVLKLRVCCATLYATGLRISEACRLKTEDVDAARGVIHVHDGKGRKDRLVSMGTQLLPLLRDYWRQERPPAPWMFASRNGHLRPEPVRAALRKAAKQAGVHKRVTPHILRHCYATHMLEQGIELPVLQAMLGHERVDTTTRYTRVSAGLIARKKSPLDWLASPR